MAGRRFPHLGWTLGRWRDPPRYDHRHVRPHGGAPGAGGVGLITEHPIGVLVVAAVLVTILFRLREAFEFFFYALVAGVIWGFILWLRRR